ncbi:hypothetical protein CI109_106219 [Kwoniella shandongensis]|uniref:Uncharacterized protein n=1 Tax=Kwoniella shandongensis TaxID=1734106 RepID=A0A5M6BZQ3_9TREE|nr:uncharacterized protein CI109_003823 [Kwoniella shandongensis]KAA5527851.1 hypothetical protein CI109_003823 [Kwoniella shandongensis]
MPPVSQRTLIKTSIGCLAFTILLIFSPSSSSSSRSHSSDDSDSAVQYVTTTSNNKGYGKWLFGPEPEESDEGSDHDNLGGKGWWGGGVTNWIGGWRKDGVVGNGASGSALREGEGEDGWVDFGTGMPTTTYDGGLPGYQVFSNLYLTGSSLLFVQPPENLELELERLDDPESEGETEQELALDQRPILHESEAVAGGSKTIPETKFVVSSDKRGSDAGEDRWRVESYDVGREELGERGYKLGGVTYIFNDGPGPTGYLVYFRHFVIEAFLGATRVLASTLSPGSLVPTPKRVWFPRCGSDPSWRDDRGDNVWFLTHALPSATIEDASGWADRNTAGLPILLEKVVIIDRWASHAANGEVGKWGKMNALIPTVSAAQGFWEQFRANTMRSLGVDGKSDTGSRGLPVVVYVDRQKENPKMKEADHNSLVEALMSLTNIAEVHVAKLASMSKARQVELVGRAQVVISLHGDELFTALWMPATESSTVIEIFEDGGFERDFQLLATTLNHDYIAVQNDHVLTEEKWRELGTAKGEEKAKGEISVNSEFVVRIVEDLLTVQSEGGVEGI